MPALRSGVILSFGTRTNTEANGPVGTPPFPTPQPPVPNRVLPRLRRRAGPPIGVPDVRAVRVGEVRVKTGLTRFLPARLMDGNVEAVTWQGSGDLASTSRSNCFLVVPPDQPALVASETVSILL